MVKTRGSNPLFQWTAHYHQYLDEFLIDWLQPLKQALFLWDNWNNRKQTYTPTCTCSCSSCLLGPLAPILYACLHLSSFCLLVPDHILHATRFPTSHGVKLLLSNFFILKRFIKSITNCANWQNESLSRLTTANFNLTNFEQTCSYPQFNLSEGQMLL